jgi:cobalt/nickel transport system permease protein
VAFASWVATVLAAVVCAGELALSHTVPWRVACPAMANVHMLIGFGEALLTTLIIAAIARTRPDLLRPDPRGPARGLDIIPTADPAPAIPAEPIVATRRPYTEFLAYGMILAMGLALFVSPLASKWPDGLDRVAEKLGFRERELDRQLVQKYSPMPDYLSSHGAVATGFAGGVGTVVAFGLALLLARVLVPEPVKEQENL